MTGGLFSDDRFRVHESQTSRALARLGVGCPDCGGPLTAVSVEEDALFVHGGYGATRRTTWDVCSGPQCRWSYERAVDEIRPPVRPGRLG